MLKFIMRGNKSLKFIDRYVGIPLIVLLGLLKSNHSQITALGQIALMKTAAIGDTILLSGIIRDILEVLPGVRIVLFVGPSNFEIAKLIEKQFQRLEVVKLSMKNPYKDIKEIRRFHFDAFLDFGSWPRINAIYAWFANASLKVGFRTPKQYRHYVYDLVVDHRDDIHELDNYRRIVEAIGISSNSLPEISLPPVKREKDLIVIHMFPGGSKSFLKEWPQEYWIELIDYFAGRGYKIALTGAKADRERAIETYRLCRSKDTVSVVAGKLGLEEVGLLLKRSALVISVNTGIMHYASALGCNLVVLHGPTSAKRWGPLNKNAISIQSSLDCSPCLNLGFEYKCNQNKCMRVIKVKEVIYAAERLLSTVV